jgi:hypothetical protein
MRNGMRRALVVDDEANVGYLLSMALRLDGWIVRVSETSSVREFSSPAGWAAMAHPASIREGHNDAHHRLPPGQARAWSARRLLLGLRRGDFMTGRLVHLELHTGQARSCA